jgi:hypothetical protein
MEEKDQAAYLAGERIFAEWPLMILHDDADVARSSPDFFGQPGRGLSRRRYLRSGNVSCSSSSLLQVTYRD